MAYTLSKKAPSGKVPCTFNDCPQLFNTVNEMKKHKVSNPDHEYCSKCDEDFTTEEQHLIHLIKSTRHVACPICGVEFRSEGGRDGHIRQNHRTAQNIACKGCKVKFKSAAGLMVHIEKNECGVISSDRLLLEQSKKIMAKEALERPARLPLVPDADDDDADGGVKIPQSLSDFNREAMANQPKQGVDDPTASVSAMLALKHWPKLQDKRRKVSLADASDLIAFSDLSTGSDKGKDKDKDDEDEHDNENIVWKGNARASPVVDSDATLTERPGPGTVAGSGPVPNRETIDPGILLRAMYSGWDATNFFDPFNATYICPCGDRITDLKKFEAHVLAQSRGDRRMQCPGCLRIFKSTAALIAHCESPTTRCSINEGQRFSQIIEEVSGGVIKTAGFNEDGTLKYEAGELVITQTTTIGVDLNKIW